MKNFKDYKDYNVSNLVAELNKRLQATKVGNNIKLSHKYFKKYSSTFMDLITKEMEQYYNHHPEAIKRTSAGNIRKNYAVECYQPGYFGNNDNIIYLWNRNIKIVFDKGYTYTYITGYEWHYNNTRITSFEQLEMIAKVYAEYQVKNKVFEHWNKFDKLKSKKKKPLLQAKSLNDIKKHVKSLVGNCSIKSSKLTGDMKTSSYKHLVLTFDNDKSVKFLICKSKNPLTIHKHLVKYNEDTIPDLVEYFNLKNKLEEKHKALKKLGISTGWSGHYG